METPYPSFEFEAEVRPGGLIALPRALRARAKDGMKVTVRITEGTVSRSLRDRSITEQDVEHIASLQMEQREHVLRFLSAEGALADTGARRKRVSERKNSRF